MALRPVDADLDGERFVAGCRVPQGHVGAVLQHHRVGRQGAERAVRRHLHLLPPQHSLILDRVEGKVARLHHGQQRAADEQPLNELRPLAGTQQGQGVVVRNIQLHGRVVELEDEEPSAFEGRDAPAAAVVVAQQHAVLILFLVQRLQRVPAADDDGDSRAVGVQPALHHTGDVLGRVVQLVAPVDVLRQPASHGAVPSEDPSPAVGRLHEDLSSVPRRIDVPASDARLPAGGLRCAVAHPAVPEPLAFHLGVAREEELLLDDVSATSGEPHTGEDIFVVDLEENLPHNLRVQVVQNDGLERLHCKCLQTGIASLFDSQSSGEILMETGKCQEMGLLKQRVMNTRKTKAKPMARGDMHQTSVLGFVGAACYFKVRIP